MGKTYVEVRPEDKIDCDLVDIGGHVVADLSNVDVFFRSRGDTADLVDQVGLKYGGKLGADKRLTLIADRILALQKSVK